MQIIDMLGSRILQIINLNISKRQWELQMDILMIGYFTEQVVKCSKILVCKVQNG